MKDVDEPILTRREAAPPRGDEARTGKPGGSGRWLRLGCAGVVLLNLAVVGTVAGPYALHVAEPARPSRPAPEGMVWIPEGTFYMGCDELSAWDARPRRWEWVGGFWMDQTEVTNQKFEEFVRRTGHITAAERNQSSAPRAADPAGGTPSVFVAHPGETPSRDGASCWKRVVGADWRHPEGPGSSIAGRELHPVVHIAWEDAAAYAQWAGKRLPTEAEWERAARGGLHGKRFVWGDKLTPGGRWMANVTQEAVPDTLSLDDGYAGTAPVGSFSPNRYGLYDMAGNGWGGCADASRWDSSAKNSHAGRDPSEPKVFTRAMRGGSFVCSDSTCAGYVLGYRGKWEPDNPANHIGFRCVKSAD